MAKIKAGAPAPPFCMRRQVSEEIFVLEAQRRVREPSRRLRHFAKAVRASWILIEPDRIIVIPAHCNGCLRPDKINHRPWFGAVVHQVPQNPQFIVGFIDRRQGIVITVNVENDQNPHGTHQKLANRPHRSSISCGDCASERKLPWFEGGASSRIRASKRRGRHFFGH